MTVPMDVVSPRVPARQYIGLPDWKLGPLRKGSGNQAQHHRATSPGNHRRHADRREKRQTSSKPRQYRGEDNLNRTGYDQQVRHYRERNHQDMSAVRQQPGETLPQHEIEFVKESNNNNNNNNFILQNPFRSHPQPPYNPAKKDRSEQKAPIDTGLFSFPWKWNPGEDEANDKKAGVVTGTRGARIPETSVLTETDASRKGVPSVVFAIHDTGKDGTNDSRESPTPSPISEPLFKKPHRRFKRHAPKPEEDLPEDLRPIPPSPRAPVMVGNRNEPIPCSESLERGSSRRYGRGGAAGRIRPPSYRRTLKKKTIHELTALESVSTYDLEQRYRVSEVQNVLANSKAATGKDLIALPKLDTAAPRDRDYYSSVRSSRVAAPPARIDGHIVYNLSGPPAKRQEKVKASATAHTSSISESLEKMKSNLRQQQSRFSHAVFDLKAKQRKEKEVGLQRNPNTLPLLKNENYISNIFSDIASKMTTKNDKQAGSYIPRVGEILNSKREYDRENGGLGPTRVRTGGKATQEPQPLYCPDPDNPTPEQTRHRPPCRAKGSVPPTVHVEDQCSITSPITEQLSTLHSPAPKSHSSLYLPNIRSRRNTPVPDNNLPFRPSVAASPAPHLQTGDMRSKYTAPSTSRDRYGDTTPRLKYPDAHGNYRYQSPRAQTQGTGSRSRFPSAQEIIDVTGHASPIHGKAKIDVPDCTTNNPRTHAKSKGKDVIDVTSLSSSRLSKTTIKDVICVEEDSMGVIRSRRKMAAMPKRRRRRASPPSRSRQLADRYSEKHVDRYDEIRRDRDRSSYRRQRGESRCSGRPELLEGVTAEVAKQVSHVANCPMTAKGLGSSQLDNQSGDQKDRLEEHEIVFSPCNDTKKGLFEGIWDLDARNEYLNELLPKNKTPILPPQAEAAVQLSDTVSKKSTHPVNALEGKGPLFTSPSSRNQKSSSDLVDTEGFMTPPSQGKNLWERATNRNQLQPPEKMRSPMEASAEGPSVSSPQRASNRPSSLVGGKLAPLPEAHPTPRCLPRGRDPSVLPWAKRRDAPITVGNKREPEGTFSSKPILGDDVTSEDQETTEETAESLQPPPIPRRRHNQIVRPKALRRPSALSKKKGPSCERSIETRSVTFQEGETLLGPRGEKVPNFICTEATGTDTSSKRHSKSVRRNEHPWELGSPHSEGSSQNKPFSDLTTREVGHKKKRRSADSHEKLSSRRHDSRKGRSAGTKRSMYDEVLDVAAPQQVIILDDAASQQYEVIPSDSPNRRKKKLWDDVSDLNKSYRSHGKAWESLGDGRTDPRMISDTISSPSKARSSRSMKRAAKERERQRREKAMFFDFLCF